MQNELRAREREASRLREELEEGERDKDRLRKESEFSRKALKEKENQYNELVEEKEEAEETHMRAMFEERTRLGAEKKAAAQALEQKFQGVLLLKDQELVQVQGRLEAALLAAAEAPTPRGVDVAREELNTLQEERRQHREAAEVLKRAHEEELAQLEGERAECAR